MPPPLRTTRSAFAVGDEITWGTYVTPNRFYRTEDGGLDIHLVPDIGYNGAASDGFLPASGAIKGPHHWEGTVPVMLDYKENGRLFKHIMGAVSAAPTTVDTNARQHVWNTDPTHPAVDGKGLSVEVPLSNTGSGSVLRYNGGKVQEARFHFEPKRVATLTLSLLGKTVVPATALPTTYTFSGEPKIGQNLGSQGVFTIGGVAFKPRTFDLTVRTGLNFPDGNLTDVSLPEPIRSGIYEITFEADVEAEDTGLFDEMTDITFDKFIPVLFEIQGPVAGATTTRYSIKFSMPRVVLDRGGDPSLDRIGDFAIMHLSGRACLPDAATDPPAPTLPPNELQIVVVNKNTATDT